MRKGKHHAPAQEEADAPEEGVAADEHLPTPAAPPTVAAVGAPTTATDELSRLLPAHGEVSGLSLVLALVAVAGGGAAWKFYSQRSRERHELAMRELELRAAGGAAQGPECKADSAALREGQRRLEEQATATAGTVSDLSGRVAQLESQAQTPPVAVGLDDLEARIEKLEQAGKPARRGRAKP